MARESRNQQRAQAKELRSDGLTILQISRRMLVSESWVRRLLKAERLEPKTCPRCGRVFDPFNGNQVYCCHWCATEPETPDERRARRRRELLADLAK